LPIQRILSDREVQFRKSCPPVENVNEIPELQKKSLRKTSAKTIKSIDNTTCKCKFNQSPETALRKRKKRTFSGTDRDVSYKKGIF